RPDATKTASRLLWFGLSSRRSPRRSGGTTFDIRCITLAREPGTLVPRPVCVRHQAELPLVWQSPCARAARREPYSCHSIADRRGEGSGAYVTTLASVGRKVYRAGEPPAYSSRHRPGIVQRPVCAPGPMASSLYRRPPPRGDRDYGIPLLSHPASYRC